MSLNDEKLEETENKERTTHNICNYCLKDFSFNSTLIKHMRIHTGERPYSCNFHNCDQRFSQVSNLIRHRKIHLGIKPFKCNLCLKTFTSSSNLKQHQIVHENDIKRTKYYCFVRKCTKNYLYICTLKKHVQSNHHEEYDIIIKEKPVWKNFLEVYEYLKGIKGKFNFLEFKDETQVIKKTKKKQEFRKINNQESKQTEERDGGKIINNVDNVENNLSNCNTSKNTDFFKALLNLDDYKSRFEKVYLNQVTDSIGKLFYYLKDLQNQNLY